MHRAEAAYLEELASVNGVPWYAEAMRIGGVPAELATGMESALRGNRPAFRTHHPALTLEGGETIPMRGGTFEVIWTPGHAPGHVCLYSPEQRTLISGDHVLQKITPNIAWHPGTGHAGAVSRVASNCCCPMTSTWCCPRTGRNSRSSRRDPRHQPSITKSVAGNFQTRSSRQPMTAHELVLVAMETQPVGVSSQLRGVRDPGPPGIHVEARTDWPRKPCRGRSGLGAKTQLNFSPRSSYSKAEKSTCSRFCCGAFCS